MKRRLFLTGAMGCGKSTAIEKALGSNLGKCGGFRTVRELGTDGRALRFHLESPDGTLRLPFLDFSGGKPEVDLSVFAQAAGMLKGEALVLDEIGGVELLCPAFSAALEHLLKTDVPILGVLKGEAPAGALIKALGLTREYAQAAARLRRRMGEDPDTLLYPCGQFDETALSLARMWVKEYIHD